MEHVVQFDGTRGTLPGLDMGVTGAEMFLFRKKHPTQVLHGCRQLVS